uniref:Uncharacterized protein n=1 Tax=Tanacetum cinerariifolium TaxID=118510 RepID=A0A6L2KTM4_TANCI|nr:hypothetical protein [Tanacetum cinerariifolium]
MDPYNHSTHIFIKLPILDTRKFEQWKFKIQQYLQHKHYALWEVIEFGDSYKAPPEETTKDKGLAGKVSLSIKKKGIIVAITAEDIQKRKNDVKARTTLLFALLMNINVQQAVKEKESPLRFIALLNWFHEARMTTSNETTKKDDSIPKNNAPQKEQEEVNGDKEVPESIGNSNPTAITKVSTNDSFELASSSTVKTEVPTVSTHVPTDSLYVPPITSSVPKIISRGGSSFPKPLSLGNAMSFENRLEDFFGDTFDAVSLNDVEADLNNMEIAIQFSPTPTLINHKDHPKSQIIGPVDTPVQTRQKTKNVDKQSFIATIHQKTNLDLLHYCLFSCFLSQEEPKKIFDALKDPSWVEAMQQELL